MSGGKIAVVGFARPHRDEAPFNDPEWEIWTCNDAWTWAPRITRHFEIHSPEIFSWPMRRAPGHLDWLAQTDATVYMLEHYEDFPSSVAFPLQECIKELSSGRLPYFTSTIAYMLALAIMERPQTIGIWGVDMASQSEYANQRPCCEWLIGIAEGRGIEMVIPDNCQIMKGPMYGRGWMNPGGERITQNQLANRLKEAAEREQWYERQCDEWSRKLAHIEGQYQECRRALGEFAGQNPEKINAMRQRADDLQNAREKAGTRFEQYREALWVARGAKEETARWISATPEGADPRLVGAEATLHAPPLVGVETVIESDEIGPPKGLGLQEV